MYVVLVYDVSQQENGAKRWSKIFKICKRYLTHIQNSVFEGEISKAQLAQLQQELKFCIDKELDSVIIFKSRQEKWLDKDFWGRKDDLTSLLLLLSTSDRVKTSGGRQCLIYQENLKNESCPER